MARTWTSWTEDEHTNDTHTRVHSHKKELGRRHSECCRYMGRRRCNFLFRRCRRTPSQTPANSASRVSVRFRWTACISNMCELTKYMMIFCRIVYRVFVCVYVSGLLMLQSDTIKHIERCGNVVWTYCALLPVKMTRTGHIIIMWSIEIIKRMSKKRAFPFTSVFVVQCACENCLRTRFSELLWSAQ